MEVASLTCRESLSPLRISSGVVSLTKCIIDKAVDFQLGFSSMPCINARTVSTVSVSGLLALMTIYML